MKNMKRRLVSLITVLAMVIMMMPVGVFAADQISSKGEIVPLFGQFYAQNQSGSWEWMSVGGQSLTSGEAQTLTFSAVDAAGLSIFNAATEDATFGLQFGDSQLKVGDQSKASLTIGDIIIKATGHDDLHISLSPNEFTENYLAEETTWGITGNTTTIDLKSYIKEDFLSYLNAITSFEITFTVTDYSYIPYEEEVEVADEIVIFEGEAISTGEWGQALSLSEGSDFKASDLKEGYKLAVSYESSKMPELVLQSWSGGAEWARVAPSDVTGNTAYFDYADMVSSYSKSTPDYESYGEAFPLLNAMHIGDTGAALTVTKVSLIQKGTVIGENPYKTGDETRIFMQFYAQEEGGNWSWYSAPAQYLTYNETQNLVFSNVDDNGESTFKDVDDTFRFGFQFGDNLLSEGDRSSLKLTVNQLTIKADGYEDIVIYSEPTVFEEKYLAEKKDWGMEGHATMVSLRDYIPGEVGAYLKAITSFEVEVCLSDYSYTQKVEEGPEFPEDYTYPTTMRDLSAMELVGDMGLGWNLGNTLDSLGGETNWGNPRTTRKMIDKIKAAGFDTLRIPITWDDNIGEGPEYLISEEYMDRVETVVNYALINDMYAIINVHHSYGWNETTAEKEEAATAEYIRIWEQISERFKDYGDQLIFEMMNEPRIDDDWTGTEEAYEIVNHYNAACFGAVRASGGNNNERLIMIPTYAASANYDAIKSLDVPEDDKVAVSIHAYAPYSFAMDTSQTSQATWGTDEDKRELEQVFTLLDETFLSEGIPVVIGEFASTNKDNLEARITHAAYYIGLAKTKGIPCVWWDNGFWDVGATDAMGLFDRRNLTWEFPEIVEAMVDAYGGDDIVIEPIDPNLIFKGEATSSGSWGQAVTITPGEDLILDRLVPYSKIAVEYVSESAPEFILQSWSGGPGWLKVTPSEVIDGTAYFTYEDLVSAYAAEMTDYESYGKNFPCLNKMYIGDTGNVLTVTKVYLIPPISIEGVSFSELPTVYEGDTLDLNEYINIFPENASNQTILDWESSNEEVVTISDEGLLTVYGPGKTTITVTMEDGSQSASYELNVPIRFDASFSVSNQWDGAINGEMVMTNLQTVNAISDWVFEFEFEGEISNIWNAKIISHEGNHYIVKNLEWNKDILPGESVNFGFTAYFEGEVTLPSAFDFVTEPVEEVVKECEITFNKVSNWDNSFTGEINILNTGENSIEGWLTTFSFTGTIDKVWKGTLIGQEGDIYTIKNEDYNKTILPGETVIIGISGTLVEDELPSNFILK